MCRKCGVREETSAHILCECKALASLRHVYLGSFFLEPLDIRSIGLGAIWNWEAQNPNANLYLFIYYTTEFDLEEGF